MEKLIKQTEKTPLSGYEKTAILLGELGTETSSAVLKHLDLSFKQSRKIRKAMKKLGKYNPNDYKQVGRELQVLSETVFYLKRKIEASPKKADLSLQLNLNTENDAAKHVSEAVKNNPDEIAKILKSWLGD